ncbi:MAG: dockerin type I domain-containing protein [bacterium]|nr:dockerin type I domain-containing protein [bacterium]
MNNISNDSGSTINKTLIKKVFYAVGAGIGAALVLVFVVFFSDYLGALVLQANSPRMAVKQGEMITLPLPAVKGVTVYKIEVCSLVKLITVCRPIPYKVLDKTMNFQLPANYVLGKAYIKITGRDSNGKQVVVGKKALLVNKAEIIADGGGEKPEKGYGSSNSSTNSAPTPTPVVASATPVATSTATPTPPVLGANLPCPSSYLDVNGDNKLTADDDNLVKAYLDGVPRTITKTGAVWQNQLNPVDVNNNNIVEAMDSALVVNAINLYGAGDIAPKTCGLDLACPQPYLDVNGDNKLTADDDNLVKAYLDGVPRTITKTGAVWQNQVNPLDVDGNLVVNATDSITVVNAIDQGTGNIMSRTCVAP